MKNTEPFKIEKGIPIPDQLGRGRRVKYPYKEMEVGDSIFVSKNRNMAHTAKSWTKTRKLKWEWAAVREGDGSRLWRIK